MPHEYFGAFTHSSPADYSLLKPENLGFSLIRQSEYCYPRKFSKNLIDRVCPRTIIRLHEYCFTLLFDTRFVTLKLVKY